MLFQYPGKRRLTLLRRRRTAAATEAVAIDAVADEITETIVTTTHTSNSSHHMASPTVQDRTRHQRRRLHHHREKLAPLIHMPSTAATRTTWLCGIRLLRSNNSKEVRVSNGPRALKLSDVSAVTLMHMLLRPRRLMLACMTDTQDLWLDCFSPTGLLSTSSRPL